MKITKETIATKQTRLHFVCDHEGCTFSTYNIEDAQEHEAYTHALAEKRETEAGTFYRFNSEEDYESFTHNTPFLFGTWSGPGWYGTERFRQTFRLIPALEILQTIKGERDNVTKKINIIEAILGA